MDDPVGVDVEGHFDLGYAAGRRRQVDELELAQCLVVHRHFPLALEHVDLDRRLHVLRSREDLALLGRDGRVALYQFRHHAALGLDTEREGRHVEQEDVFHLALEDTGLDGSTDGHDLVGVDPLVRVFARKAAHELLDGGHAGGPADEDDMVDLLLGEPGVLHGLVERSAAGLHEVGRHLLELGPGQLPVQVLGAFAGGGNKREVDVGLLDGGELDLGLFSRLLQPLQRHPVLGKVHALGVLERLHEPVDHPLVPVVAAQVRIAAGGLDLENTFADLQSGHVKRAAAEVEHEDGLLRALLVQAVRQGGRGGLVDDPQHFEAGYLARFFGRSALGVVEVGGDGDDGLGDRRPEVALGVPLQLLQDASGDLLGRIALGVDVDVPGVVAHMALHGTDGPVRVGDGLAFGDLTDEDFARLRKAHDRGSGTGALGIGDDGRLATFQNGDY